MSKSIDLGKRLNDGKWARYLPALSTFYVKHLASDLNDPTFINKDRIPADFEHGIQGLNFLDPENSYFHYPYALYSAGHAECRLDRCDDKEPMVHKRNRKKTTLVSDSGGFQIATGVIKLDWSAFDGPEGDALRERILRYSEHTADWSMTLDVPPFAASLSSSESTGLRTVQDCLNFSIINLNYFIKHRIPGTTKFLNVLSGVDAITSKQWYEAVKHYSIPKSVEEMGHSRDKTLEGWAFAGTNMKNMRCTLSRLLDLRNDNLLEGKDWIHFLGIGRLDWACYLTSIERTLRKHYNPNIVISYDAASPFVAAGGYALSYDYNYFTPERLTYSMGSGLDNKSFKGTKYRMPFSSPINDRLTTGDICVNGPTDLNKNGKIGKTSWDSTSYALIMAHNVYNHIHAVQEINRLADIAYAKVGPVEPSDWYQYKGKKKVTNKDEFVPNNILYFNSLVQKILDPATPNPYELIEEYGAFLDSISFGNKQITTTLGDNSMWGEVENKSIASTPTVEDLADSDNIDLIDEE